MRAVLAGQVAVVTGAGNGLGAAVARLLSAAGAATVLVSRRTAGIEDVAREIEAGGGIALPHATDIAKAADNDALVGRTLAAYGRIDIVVNIAGTVNGVGKPTWELTPAEWLQLCDTNISGPFQLCRTVVPAMLRQRAGRILMLTSTSADMPTPGAAAYGATKAAVNQLVRALAVELDGSGVTVNAFNPGPAATPTLDYVERNLDFGRWRGRWGGLNRSPEEAARIVLWLCSPATAHLTGQSVHWRDPATQAAIAEMERSLA